MSNDIVKCLNFLSRRFGIVCARSRFEVQLQRYCKDPADVNKDDDKLMYQHSQLRLTTDKDSNNVSLSNKEYIWKQAAIVSRPIY